MPGREDALVVDGVSVGYGRHPILHDVSLTARAGEVTGLIGPNGSGKTTMVRVASRALRPAQGSVRIGGVDPYSIPARSSARLIGVVPQEVVPAFSYSVLEMVMMGRSPYLGRFGTAKREDWAKVRWAMAAANVQHLADRPIEELSGGEHQRVILAQALAQDAPVLLLDEPTTHLDIRHVFEFLGVVRRLARRDGKTVLAVFHDLNIAAATCDRIVALSAGRVVAHGPPGEVLTRDLVWEVFGVEADVAPAESTGRPFVSVAPPPDAGGPEGTGARAHVIGGAGRGAAAMRALAERGFEVTAGVLHSGDTDDMVAERLGLLRVTVPPFSPIDARSAADCRELLRSAALVVVADAPFGPGNLENLRLAQEFAAAGTRTLVLEQVPIEERDFTGGEATTLWRALRRRAHVCSSAGELARALDAATQRS